MTGQRKKVKITMRGLNMNEAQQIVHPIPPLYNTNCTRLVLGSFPSVKSRETNFFYGHPQNRYWRLLALLYSEAVPQSIEEKRNFALNHNIAMWDVIHSCVITGSSDSSIKNVVPNDLTEILNACKISRIFTNGTASYNLYMKYIYPKTGMAAVKLPSTSPANAAFSIERLAQYWNVLLEE